MEKFRSHDTPRLAFLSWPISAFPSFYLYTFAKHVGKMLNSDVRSGAKKMSSTFARISPLPDMIAQVLKALRVPEIISINLMYSRPM